MDNAKVFYELVIYPFISPFYELAINFVPKLIIGMFSLIVVLTIEILGLTDEISRFILINSGLEKEIVAAILSLIHTPLTYWFGLMGLVVIDFVAGTGRAIFDSRIKFNARRFSRTAYKFVVYPLIMIVTAISTNMFPYLFGWTQYMVVAILVGNEAYSILRNVGLLTIARVLVKYGLEKHGLDKHEFMELFHEEDNKLLGNQNREDLDM